MSDVPPDRKEAKSFARRMRKGLGADDTASGATRVAGTFNYKRKYEPQFPMVTIVAVAPGRTVTQAELEAQGIVAPAELYDAPASPLRVSNRGTKPWQVTKKCWSAHQ